MNELLDFVIERHVGIGSWNEASTVSATVHVHGSLRDFDGQPSRLGVASVAADVRRQRVTASHDAAHLGGRPRPATT
jgi:hypothetical protein